MCFGVEYASWGAFWVVFDTVRHTNVQKKAEYRRIHRYYKSVEKYNAEESRRKRVLALWESGVSLKEIAKQVGVSVSTVKQDLNKLSRYIKGRRRRSIEADHEEFRREFRTWSVEKQGAYFRRQRERERNSQTCKALIITFDFDAALSGRYALIFKPNLPIQVHGQCRVTFVVVACGRRQVLGRTYLYELPDGGVNMHTNDSLKAFIEPVFEGLRVIDSSKGN